MVSLANALSSSKLFHDSFLFQNTKISKAPEIFQSCFSVVFQEEMQFPVTLNRSKPYLKSDTCAYGPRKVQKSHLF